MVRKICHLCEYEMQEIHNGQILTKTNCYIGNGGNAGPRVIKIIHINGGGGGGGGGGKYSLIE